MIFGVPQYIDIEDKIAFRLTAKQLGWFALAGVVMFGVWYFFEFWVFVIASIVCLSLAAMFSFYRPSGLSLFSFLGHGLSFLTSYKILWWDKGAEDLEGKKVAKEKTEEYVQRIKSKTSKLEKSKTISELEYIAEALDRKSDL